MSRSCSMHCRKKLMALITWRGFFSACPTRGASCILHRPRALLVPAPAGSCSGPQCPPRPRRLHSPGASDVFGRGDNARIRPLRSTFATHADVSQGFSQNGTTTTATTRTTTTPPPKVMEDALLTSPILPPRTVPARFVNVPFPYHHLLTLKVESLTNRGWGVGRVNLSPPPAPPSPLDSDPTDATTTTNNNNTHHQPNTPTNPPPWVVLVSPGAIPGETIQVRIFRNFATYSEADLVQVVDNVSPDRIVPPCPVFGECGGCQYQHMTIELQREWKTRHVTEALHQYGIVDVEVAPCLGTDEIYGYRSKLTPHYEAPSSGRKRNAQNPELTSSSAGIREIGFQRQTSRQIVDVPVCAIATDPVNAAYHRLRDELKAAPPPTSKKQKGATLLLRQANAHDESVTTNHHDVLTTTVLGKNFEYRAGNFFQNNYFVLPLLVQHVVEAAARPLPIPQIVVVTGAVGDATTNNNTASPPMPTHLVDCYCGSGLFAVSASDRFETVMGIEINDRAVEEATQNAARNHVTGDRCHFVAATAETIFAQLDDYPRDRTVVVLDPPRKGCSGVFLQQLWDFRPVRIVYVSCDPVTQARDVRDLLDRAGGTGDDENGYDIESVQPFDLFPQTRHIECLIVLNRRTTPTTGR